MSGKVWLTDAAVSGSFLAGRRCRDSFLEWRHDNRLLRAFDDRDQLLALGTGDLELIQGLMGVIHERVPFFLLGR